jgi:hypothetical protein
MNTLQRIIDPVPALFALAALIGVLLSGCASTGSGPEYPLDQFLDPVTEVVPDVR